MNILTTPKICRVWGELFALQGGCEELLLVLHFFWLLRLEAKLLAIIKDIKYEASFDWNFIWIE